jgi:hypothetical protein
MPIIYLNNDECKEAITFGKEILAKKAQSTRDFGSAINRGESDNLVDIIEGKIAELGFAKYFKNSTGNDLLIDFKVYNNKLTIDYGQDFDGVVINGDTYVTKCRIDIKATRNFSKWLLVESHKFWADVYILAKVNVPPDSETNIENFFNFITNNTVEVNIVGYAYYFDLIHYETKEPFIKFLQNNRLFRPEHLVNISDWTPDGIIKYMAEHVDRFPLMGPYLKSPVNFGLPIIKLRQTNEQWQELFQWVMVSLNKI